MFWDRNDKDVLLHRSQKISVDFKIDLLLYSETIEDLDNIRPVRFYLRLSLRIDKDAKPDRSQTTVITSDELFQRNRHII